MTSRTADSPGLQRRRQPLWLRGSARRAVATTAAALVAVVLLLGWAGGNVSAGAAPQLGGSGITGNTRDIRSSLVPGSVLGGLDLTGYCQTIGYDHSEVMGNLTSPPNIGPNAAYGWVCVAAPGSSLPSPYRISRSYGDMYLPCQQQYPGQNAAPLLGDPNDAYTWTCVVAGSATPPPGSEITGRVCIASEPACSGGGANGGIDGATVTACATNVATPSGTVPFFCSYTSTDASGYYAIGNLPAGLYSLTADPPPSSGFVAAPLPAQISNGATGVLTENFSLTAAPGPSASGIEGAFGDPSAPTIDSTWSSYIFDTFGCPGGSFSYKLVLDETVYSATGTIPAGSVLAGGPMTQVSQSGGIAHFQASFDHPLAPAHGKATLSFSFICATGSGTAGSIPIYIDPSGTALNQKGRPISGASVTLYFSPIDAGGPFLPVPNGSTTMDPGNRHNPETTGADGRFGWDVLPGLYKVVATRPGCTGPDLAHSAVYTVPPAVTGVRLTLQCSDTTPPDVSLDGHPERRTSATTATFSFHATDRDDHSGISFACRLDTGAFETCSSPKSYSGLAAGPHTFRVRATDAAGNTSAVERFHWVVGSGPDDCGQPGRHDDGCGGGDDHGDGDSHDQGGRND